MNPLLGRLGQGICAAVLGVYLLLSPRPAAAVYVSGGDLVQNCLSDKKHDVYACVHYVAGVIDYHTVMQSVGTAPTLSFCIPAGVSVSEAAYVVLRYLRSQPMQQGFVAAMSVPLALNKTYPCPKPAPKKSGGKKK